MLDSTDKTASNHATNAPRRAAKLTIVDAEAIAIKVAKKRLTEAEACHQLGIKPDQWYVWKCRGKHSARFENICARVRGAAIENAIDRVEKAGEDLIVDLGDGKTAIKRGDWRADHARLALIAPERFGQREQSQDARQQVIIGDSALKMILDKVYSQPQVTTQEPVKQLNDSVIDATTT